MKVVATTATFSSVNRIEPQPLQAGFNHLLDVKIHLSRLQKMTVSLQLKRSQLFSLRKLCLPLTLNKRSPKPEAEVT